MLWNGLRGFAFAVAFAASLVTVSGVARAERVKRLAPIEFRDFDGQTLRLVPWQGKHVTLLLGPGGSAQVIGKIAGALDRSWDFYAEISGSLPAHDSSLHGRDEIAEVPTLNICGGAACTNLGGTGTEILPQYFDALYNDVVYLHEYDQALFYELGRSFWFWSSQLAPGDVGNPYGNSVTTGYAVLMRWESMQAEHIPGGPVLDPDGSGRQVSFRQARSDMVALLGYYEQHPALTFAETLGQDKSPAPGLLQGTDFYSSIMWHLAARHGGALFLRRFFHHAFALPPTRTVTGAVTNWVRDASYAACVNLAPLFYRQWGFPRPGGRVTPRPPAGTVREPRGSCARRR